MRRLVLLAFAIGCTKPAPVEKTAPPVVDAAQPVIVSFDPEIAPPPRRKEPPVRQMRALLADSNAQGFFGMTAEDGPGFIWPTVLGGTDETRPVLVASFTKLWVAIAVLRSVARKELSLDDEVRALIPALKAKPWSDSTVRELLSHTSRVPEFDEKGGFYSRTDIDFTDPVPVLVKELSSATEKRGVWKYRNAEYALLGAILQTKSGRPVADVLATEVFERVGMKNAGIAVLKAPATVDFSPMGRIRPQNFFTAGNGYASPNDLLAFFDGLWTDRLLDAEWRAVLFAGSPRNNMAALGCWAYPYDNGDGGTTLLVERPGAFGNVKLFTAFFPEKHRAVVLWSKTPIDIGKPRDRQSLAAKLSRLALDY